MENLSKDSQEYFEGIIQAWKKLFILVDANHEFQLSWWHEQIDLYKFLPDHPIVEYIINGMKMERDEISKIVDEENKLAIRNNARPRAIGVNHVEPAQAVIGLFNIGVLSDDTFPKFVRLVTNQKQAPIKWTDTPWKLIIILTHLFSLNRESTHFKDLNIYQYIIDNFRRKDNSLFTNKILSDSLKQAEDSYLYKEFNDKLTQYFDINYPEFR